MSTTQRAISSGTRRIYPYKSICSPCSRRSFTQRLVRANDIVLLKPETNPKAVPTLSKPLKRGESLVFRDHRKVVADDVIGKPYRSVVAGGRRALFRIYEPTLGQYCDNAPRIVTPIYSSDASLIVSLLDLNFAAVPSKQSETTIEVQRLRPNRPLNERVVSQDEGDLKPATSPESENLESTDILEKDELLEENKELPEKPTELTDAELLEDWDFVDQHNETLEIFEAGTGAGSLTLHLARAIHGANTRAPPIPRLPKTKGKITPDDDIYGYGGKFGARNVKMTDLYHEWRSQRRAVIHSLDADEHHSRYAQRTVRNYRHGLYFPHIDFHVGSIHDYLSKRLEETKGVFLDHAILDIPGIQDEMEIVGKCIKPDGRLITWCPSITQHMKCLEIVKGKKLPFVLDRVLELGSQLSTGGREWEVRLAKPRALIKAEMKAKVEEMEREDRSKTVSAVDEWLTKISSKDEVTSEDVETSESESVTVQGSTGEASDHTDMSGWEMICRPKVGDRITGGGFVGVWKKMDMNV
ncbi:uncharacterized protein EAF01_007249 [Botrytis porri]|uniref:tRNA (adenine(58)-N(1))-methyltransferase catalytic subunit TRM61 n=1 Tax=Botrytis porri TaxID=87229 RepID=A0A4Z1K5Y3_9HELO|nr:uncharacterized protein EAF01_007249 [Botrytis porri]KAF7901951.1 hypothetical protein EAF01_007249 [Botrytis porri]TGO81509.1 hypothetical protein BPOR_1125g00040 [Botrytis porri]